MIIQTGQRTDIPAFYTEWFLNRLREGYVLVRNPYNPQSVTRYNLSPDVVDLIGFCTKNPGPMLPYLTELLERGFGQYWFVTITPYGQDIESNVPPKEQVLADFRKLSEAVGVDCVGWRYDPVFVNDVYTVEYHLEAFRQMASELAGYTKTCVISFVDRYEKVKRNFPEVRSVSREHQIYLTSKFVEIGRTYGMTIKPCGEGDWLTAYGADCSGCMTAQVYEKALSTRLDVPKSKPIRTECSCVMGNDIGAYDTCGHLCRYCYANTDARLVRQNIQRHDPASPFLVGGPLPGDIIHEAKQESWIDGQLMLSL